MAVKIGILVCSDRASAGVYEDRGGPVVKAYLAEKIATAYETCFAMVPDAQAGVEQKLIELCDDEKCALIITTGGTGPAAGDQAPEATIRVSEKILPGFGEAMRMSNFPKVPTTILSRATAGVRGASLIINLPGTPKAIPECLDPVLPAITHAIRIRGGPTLELKTTGGSKDPALLCTSDHHHH